MLFKRILNFAAGYAMIEVEGYYIERFINTCMKQGIELWGIKRKMPTMLLCKIPQDSIDSVREIAKKHQCLITIKSQKGVPILIKKYKNRKAFLISLVVLLAAIFALSKFIWNIEIEGTEAIDSNEIIREVNQNGLTVGTLKNKIDVDKITNKIRMNREDIAWIGIEIKGTNAIVKVVEAKEKPEILDEEDFTNIVATKAGEIMKVTAQNGTPMVEEGDEVQKGDILIAGYMEGKYTDKYYVNSVGTVKAKIKYSQSEKIDKKEIKKVETGKKDKKFAIKFNNFKINFYKRLSKFKNYDTIYSSRKLTLFSNFYLPIEFITCEVRETVEEEEDHSKEDAKQIGENLAREKLDEKVEGEKIGENTEITENEDSYTVTVTYDVIEEIGTKEKIKF